MNSSQFDAIANQCAPFVAASTLRAIARVESNFNPFAIGVVDSRLSRQPKTLLEGISSAASLERKGAKFSAGLVQIYVKNWSSLGLDYETVFDPCRNLTAAQTILSDCYQRARQKTSAPQVALRQSISCYYSNNFVTGFRVGYVQKVVAAHAHALQTRSSIPMNPIRPISPAPFVSSASL